MRSPKSYHSVGKRQLSLRGGVHEQSCGASPLARTDHPAPYLREADGEGIVPPNPALGPERAGVLGY